MIDFKKIVDQAANIDDQSAIKSFTSREVIAEGACVLRFIGYVDLGLHDGGEWQGKAKPDTDKVYLTFEVLRKDTIREVEIEGVKTTITDRVSVRVDKKLSDKAKFKKLFNAMTYGRSDIKHMAQMLGESFLGRITHNVSKNGKTYVNLTNADGTWSLAAPYREDPETGERTKVSAPGPYNDIKVFIWDVPTKECWDDLYIEGTWVNITKNEDGTESTEERSKNFIQKQIMEAKNFDGSPIQQLLMGIDGLPTSEPVVEEKASASKDKPVSDEADYALAALADIGL